MKYKFVMFGSVKTIQVECPDCKTWQFEGKFCDCGRSLNEQLTEKERPEIRVDEPTWRDRIKRNVLQSVFERDEYTCQYCGIWCYDSYVNDPKALTVDHMLPVSVGGGNRIDNLVTCCRDCNLVKGSKLFNSFDSAREYITNEKKHWD